MKLGVNTYFFIVFTIKKTVVVVSLEISEPYVNRYDSEILFIC